MRSLSGVAPDLRILSTYCNATGGSGSISSARSISTSWKKQYPEDAHDQGALSQRAWNSLDQLLASHAVDTIYFALPANDVWGMEALAERLAGEAIEINWVPDLSSLLLLNSSVRELEGQPIICLSDSPLPADAHFSNGLKISCSASCF